MSKQKNYFDLIYHQDDDHRAEKITQKLDTIKEQKTSSVTKFASKKVICVFSPLSQGASFISIHLAKALSGCIGAKVCLLELNFYKPMIKKYVNLSPQKNFADVIASYEVGDLSYTRISMLVSHKDGFDMILASDNISDYYKDEQGDITKKLIENLAFLYDYVIIDTHSCYDLLSTNLALEVSDQIIMPLVADKYSITYINRLMKNFSEYEDYLMDKFSLIINQYSGADLTSVEVSSLLDWKVDGYIKRQQSSKFFYKKRMKDLQKTLIDVVM